MMRGGIGEAEVRAALEAAAGERGRAGGYALMICLVEGERGLEVVLEVRAATLDVQPDEVCLPGGAIEPGETAQEAAVREACEELLVEPSQLEVVGGLGNVAGPGGAPMEVFVARLTGWEGSFSADEVDRAFTVGLDWLVATDPEVHIVGAEPRFGDDFPFELIPGGRDYPWRFGAHEVPFYRGTDPIIWGATARVLWRFAKVLRG